MKFSVEAPTSHHIYVRIDLGDGVVLQAGLDGNLLALLGPRATPLAIARMLTESINDALRQHDLRQRGVPDIGAAMRLKGSTEPRLVEMIDDERRVVLFAEDETEHSWDSIEYVPVAS